MASFVVGLKAIMRHRLPTPPPFCRAPMISNNSNNITITSSPSKSTTPPPWLMLQPSIDGGDLFFKFHNLAQDRIEKGAKLPAEIDAVLVGSSHGWLAFFTPTNNHLFLLNPLSGRRLNLPAIDTLPDPEIYLRHGRATVSKLVLSCSPVDDDDVNGITCRAMMSFGPDDRLAFCCLPDDECWTPIGSLFFEKTGPCSRSYARVYEDFVYCRRRELFICTTQLYVHFYDRWIPRPPSEMDGWDLRDPRSPKLRTCCYHQLTQLGLEGGNRSWLEENKMLVRSCLQIPYLVFAEEYDQLFIVTRFVCNSDPFKTVGFCVFKVVYSRDGLEVDEVRLADSLDGLAMFVGINHSFAVRADEFGLEPNSIYFTDASNKRLNTEWANYRYDVGFFNYENKTLSPSPCISHERDLPSRVFPAPVWFTPSQLV